MGFEKVLNNAGSFAGDPTETEENWLRHENPKLKSSPIP